MAQLLSNRDAVISYGLLIGWQVPPTIDQFTAGSQWWDVCVTGLLRHRNLQATRLFCQHPVSPDLEGLPNLGDLPHLVLSFYLISQQPGCLWPGTNRGHATGMYIQLWAFPAVFEHLYPCTDIKWALSRYKDNRNRVVVLCKRRIIRIHIILSNPKKVHYPFVSINLYDELSDSGWKVYRQSRAAWAATIVVAIQSEWSVKLIIHKVAEDATATPVFTHTNKYWTIQTLIVYWCIPSAPIFILQNLCKSSVGIWLFEISCFFSCLIAGLWSHKS